MLQIISNSNETKTGPELVQNGDFSQLGADLVENGEFDELGTDVITNGGITGELVTNGNFATDLSSWTSSTYQWLSFNEVNRSSVGTGDKFSQHIATEIGEQYDVSVFVNSYDLAPSLQTDVSYKTINSTGLITQRITAVSTSTEVWIWAVNAQINFSSFSVVKVGESPSDDWTAGTSWVFGKDKAISTQALGSEEVTNGDFSAAGINLVDNPNFTDTGTEEVTYPNFTNSDISQWIDNGGKASFSWDAAEFMRLDFNETNGNAMYATFGHTLNASYKVTMRVRGTKADGTTAQGSAFSSIGDFNELGQVVSNPTLTSAWQDYEFYVVPTNVIFRFYLASVAIGDLVDFDSISVKELGADWTEFSGDPDSVSFGENGLTIVQSSDGGTENRALQGSVTEADKSYKVTYTIFDSSYTSTNRLQYYNGGAYVDLPEQGVGTHTFYYTREGTNNSWIFNLKTSTTSATDFVTISSISVQELGEGWTSLTPTNTFGEHGLTMTSTLAADVKIISAGAIVANSTSYKVTYTIHDVDLTGTNAIEYYTGSALNGYDDLPEQGVGTHTFYYTTPSSTNNNWYFRLDLRGGSTSTTDFVTISNISVKEIATSYLTQAVSLSAKTWKIIYSVSDYIAGSVSATDYGAVTTANAVGITEYVEIGVASDFRMVNIDGYFEGAVTDISAQLVDPNGYWTVGSNWSIEEDKATYTPSGFSNLLQVPGLEVGKTYKLTVTVIGTGVDICRFYFGSSSDTAYILQNGENTIIGVAEADKITFRNLQQSAFSITNVSVEQVDPNDYWTLGTGWSIGTDKAISTVTGSNSDITQSILTAGKTYRTVYEIVDYDAGTAQAVVTGSAGADAVAIETYTEDLTTTGTDFSIRSKLGTFDGAVSSVSAKLLGSYEDQSIYVTAADVQTLPQASVYYLVELTSMASKNSIYFIPSSVVPNNGRYTKLNFTVVSKDALTQPTVGIISFYDSVGGFDTYPMGFYEFKIYEQTSSTNLDPTLATGLLEKGFAFVRDFSGNMQELTDGFKEYNPTLTQYVYSK